MAGKLYKAATGGRLNWIFAVIGIAARGPLLLHEMGFS